MNKWRIADVLKEKFADDAPALIIDCVSGIIAA